MHAKSIAAIKRARTAKLAKMISRAYYLHKRNNDEAMYTYVLEEFMQMGGVYIKFLQGVLLKSEVMRRWHNPERLRIFENLETEHLNVVAILNHELSADKLRQITGIQPEPFAAGSFGQVYYGTHASGTPVIIKVLRPMVRETLRYDLKLLGTFMRRFYPFMMSNMDMDINQAIKEFTRSTLLETDYIAETAFANELYNYYQGHQNIVIPKTFTELCTPNIIVQEYIDGISVAEVIKLQEQGVDPVLYVQEKLGSNLDEQLKILGFEAIVGIFNLPRIQGDPHPGNIRLMANDKVGIIDFGISAPAPTNKQALFGLIQEWDKFYSGNDSISAMFEQFMYFFAGDLYLALKKLSAYASSQGEANFTQEIGNIAQSTLSEQMKNRDIGTLVKNGRILQIINRMVNKNNRFGLVMKLESSEIIRAVQTYMTLIEALGRHSVILPEVLRMSAEQIKKDHPELEHPAEEAMSLRRAIDIVSNWLERVAERDPQLFKNLLLKARQGKQIEVKEATNA